MFLPEGFPDKWPRSPMGVTIHIRLRVSSKVVLTLCSHASRGQLTLHVMLYQIPGHMLFLPGIHPPISIWLSQTLPIVAGNAQFPLLSGCNMSYRLQTNIWRLCMDLASNTSPCLDLQEGLKKKNPNNHPSNTHLSNTYQKLTLHKALSQLWGLYESGENGQAFGISCDPRTWVLSYWGGIRSFAWSQKI